MQTIADPGGIALGSSLPPGDVHGVGVHLPEWRDTVGWAARENRVVDAMKTGYPRFFVPRVVDVLAERILQLYHRPKSSTNGELSSTPASSVIIFPSWRYAVTCLKFLHDQAPSGTNLGEVRALCLDWTRTTANLDFAGAIEEDFEFDSDPNTKISSWKRSISAIIYPSSLRPLTKAFWQHTGFGISSRQATYWLNCPSLSGRWNGELTPRPKFDPCAQARLETAKQLIRNRIANGQSSYQMRVPNDHVLLYQTGMTAITEAAAATKLLPSRNKGRRVAAVFGFTYVDTYKTIARVLNFDTTLYKYSELDHLENQLKQGLKLDLLVTEFPSNPLLQTPDLERLHYLSNRHDFILVVDDTVGTYINVNLMQCCDIVCTSLTKMFSGACNVMGGAVVVSPFSPCKEHLLFVLRQTHDDNIWFPEDVFIMEQNSRDFRTRVRSANANAELVVAQLQNHPSIEEVYYPKKSPTQHLYDRFRCVEGGYGFLLSIKFTSPVRAIAFYDALEVAKGPSLGTNFTLCCAYTLLAHYSELEWAAEYGVVEHLVRISVGLEDKEWLRTRLDKALKAAEVVQD